MALSTQLLISRTFLDLVFEPKKVPVMLQVRGYSELRDEPDGM
jgi:hypothetical protein